MQRGVNMFYILLKSLFTLLTIFVISRLCRLAYGLVFKEKESKEVFVFIHVKEQEETIEYIVRCTIINYLHKYGGRTVPYIVIVDHGSTDKTKEIAQKLCDDYDFLFFTTSQQYEEFKKEMEARENL